MNSVQDPRCENCRCLVPACQRLCNTCFTMNGGKLKPVELDGEILSLRLEQVWDERRR